MTQKKESVETCPLCAFEFSKDDTVCLHSCPMATNCHMIQCPNCHYEFSETPRMFPWLWRLLKGNRARQMRKAGGVVPLTELNEGETAEVVDLTCEKESRRSALTVFGLTPGSEITLRQRRPVFLIQAGETTLALEREIAEEIRVKRGPAAGHGAPGGAA